MTKIKNRGKAAIAFPRRGRGDKLRQYAYDLCDHCKADRCFVWVKQSGEKVCGDCVVARAYRRSWA